MVGKWKRGEEDKKNSWATSFFLENSFEIKSRWKTYWSSFLALSVDIDFG